MHGLPNKLLQHAEEVIHPSVAIEIHSLNSICFTDLLWSV